MIIGIGTDIVEIDRVRQIVFGELGERFIARILTPAEALIAEQRRYPLPPAVEAEQFAVSARYMQFVAGRFAAKEAVAKAFGCGIGAKLSFHHIEILHDNLGRPQCSLAVDAPAVQALVRDGGWRVHLSISHTDHYATASAVLEQLPAADVKAGVTGG